MKKVLSTIVTTAMLGAATLPGLAQAAELLYFYQDGCSYCEDWEEEVGQVYPKTEEGQILTLRKVDLFSNEAKALEGLRPVHYTPTFVIVDNGQEVARMNGYMGEDMFYWMLGDIIKKHIKKEQAPVTN